MPDANGRFRGISVPDCAYIRKLEAERAALIEQARRENPGLRRKVETSLAGLRRIARG